MIGFDHGKHIYEGKMKSCEQYVKDLEEERDKIQVFRRELPLCLQLVTQAIEACKRQLPATREHFHRESESDEENISSKLGPIFGEFFPINETSSNEEQSHSHLENNIRNNKLPDNTKSDWLKSAGLWNHCQESPSNDKGDLPRRVSCVEVNRDGGTSICAFHPFKKDNRTNSTPKPTKCPPSGPAMVIGSSAKLGRNGGNNKQEEKKPKGKTRRSWSDELHKRFVRALQQLGGSHVATPKQIREVMKVDGLTNDEVKSHLQKYRLHEKRPTPLLTGNNQTQAPHFVVVEGIWVSPPEHAVVATKTVPEEASRTPNRVYAPVAVPAPHHCSNEKQRYSNDLVNSSSPDHSTTHAATTT